MWDNLLYLFGYIVLFVAVFAAVFAGAWFVLTGPLVEWLFESAERRLYQRRAKGAVRHDRKEQK